MRQQLNTLHSDFSRAVRRGTIAAMALALAAGIPAQGAAQNPAPPAPPAPPVPPTPVTPQKAATVMARVSRPDGYIGIVYSGEQRMHTSEQRKNNRVVERKVLVSYAAYPVIVSVEPGSPAERAGLAAGDTVLAYNGKDVVAEPFPLYDMLKPGARLSMRVRRNNATRTVNVTVGRRPAAHSVAVGTSGMLYTPSPEISAEVRRELARAQAELRKVLEENSELTAEQRQQLQELMRERVEVGSRAAVAPLLFSRTALTGVAGAEMAPLNEDLADLVGLRRGVFVVKVNPGTPAEKSGLRGGDVITGVGDSTVNDVAQLRRAINAEQRRIRAGTGSREIPLHIVRKHRKHKLTLRQ
ncbi:MAG TPA: PDZ domain-containing protein [Gemmatimonadaceae bacterium]